MPVEEAVPMCSKYHITAALTSSQHYTSISTGITTTVLQQYHYHYSSTAVSLHGSRTQFLLSKSLRLMFLQYHITVCFDSQNCLTINKTTFWYTTSTTLLAGLTGNSGFCSWFCFLVLVVMCKTKLAVMCFLFGIHITAWFGLKYAAISSLGWSLQW